MLTDDAVNVSRLIQSASAWHVLIGGESHLEKIRDQLLYLISQRYTPAHFPQIPITEVMQISTFAQNLFLQLWNDALETHDFGERIKGLLPLCLALCLPKKDTEDFFGKVDSILKYLL